ncbi:ATP-binding protein [Halomicronema sp. CCY15110]|uniref:ATP-binding protein n=1 Tax=Halomicronema sp. CCY15110 TaxID=2767773 RepID=UPI0019522018|nr:ATP-binding protein [Halomicronema sp. CCY15110]
MLYLSDVVQKRLAWTATGISALLLGAGGFLIFTNPQMGSQDSILRAYAAGRTRETYQSPQRYTGRALGYVSAALGLPLGAVGVVLSDRQPQSLTPTPIPKVLPDGRLVVTETALRSELQQQISELLYANDWLRACLKAHTVILCGDMGSGKTTIAAAIALIRELLWGWETMILDPHADSNLSLWLNGRVYGSEQVGKASSEQQIFKAWRLSRQRSEHHRSIVLDEFSSWGADAKSSLGSLTPDVVKHGTADARKFLHHTIYLVHGEENGMLGGSHVPTGWQAKLKQRAVGIRLIADYDEWGQPNFTGKAAFKPAGQEWVDENFQPFAMPKSLKPGVLKQQIGTHLEILGIGADVDSDVDCAVSDTVRNGVDTLLEQTFDTPEFLERLERIARGPVVGHPSEGLAASEPDIDWRQVQRIPKAIALLTYLKKKALGEIDSRKLQQNWGRHHGLDASGIQTLLDQLARCSVGEWITADNTQLQGWRLRVSPKNLPNWD